jgi:cellulose 1,4-beta-cellobiosidase
MNGRLKTLSFRWRMIMRPTMCRLATAGIAILLSSAAVGGQVDSVSSLACNPATLSSGAATTCTVTLSAAAPAGGVEVMLSSSSSTLSVPASSVTVPAGSASTTFTATAGSISTNQNATLTATALNSVSLSWSASSSTNITNYDVYRGTTSGGPYSEIATLGVMTSYTDYNVQNGQTYYYVTAAITSSGQESAYSNQATAVVPSG